jgi:hypothetical protein
MLDVSIDDSTEQASDRKPIPSINLDEIELL